MTAFEQTMTTIDNRVRQIKWDTRRMSKLETRLNTADGDELLTVAKDIESTVNRVGELIQSCTVIMTMLAEISMTLPPAEALVIANRLADQLEPLRSWNTQCRKASDALLRRANELSVR